MARVKISEYRAKKILLGSDYRGISLTGTQTKLPAGKLVVKVDQGVKKRMKQGLLAVNVTAKDVPRHVAAWQKKGFSQFLVEPLFPHDEKDEQYLSLERVRDGLRVLHAREGGIEIEAHPEAVQTYLIRSQDDVADVAARAGIPAAFLSRVIEAFDAHYFAFLEMNPLVVRGEEAVPLDAAALVDSAGAFFTHAWDSDDVVHVRLAHKAEERVQALDATTPASLKLNVLNKDGALFLLLSSGGGSIVIADEAQLLGMGASIGNYGEYSGGPTRQETYLYAKEVIQLMLASKAKKKALVIAGGVANFTDVKKTFAGIIDAFAEHVAAMRKQGIRVFVRRGGPNEKAGLALMRDFLTEQDLFGSVYGSDAVITQAVDDAVSFLKK